jgi:hypothetical protein
VGKNFSQKLLIKMITKDNYYLNTFAVFKACKRPKRKPDFISYSKDVKMLKITIDSIREYIDRTEGAYNNCHYINEKGVEFIENQFKISSPLIFNELMLYEINGKADIHYSPISSEYWYGSDKNGDYIIRSSDHWSKRNEEIDCRNVASCIWNLFVPKKSKHIERGKCCGKAYIHWFKKRSLK